MSSEFLTLYVSVRDANQLLDENYCRLVTYPDGGPAVIWRGQAFPLIAGDTIDVAGDFRAPRECGPPGTGERSAARPFALIDGDAEVYILLDGTVAERDAAASALSNEGLKVIRSGRYLGEVEATWFIRLEKPIGDEALENRISRALGSVLAAARVALAAEPDLRLRLLAAQLATARAREAELQREIDRLRTLLIPTCPPVAPEPAEDEVETLRLALDEQHRLLAETEVALASALAELSAKPRRGPAPSARILKDMVAVFEELLPRLSLLGDSMGFVVAEMSDRKALFRYLRELQERSQGMPLGWKGVQGADGWWERHVSTGQDDAGRIYARKSAADARWSVLISHKGDQSRDIDRLRRLKD